MLSVLKIKNNECQVAINNSIKKNRNILKIWQRLEGVYSYMYSVKIIGLFSSELNQKKKIVIQKYSRFPGGFIAGFTLSNVRKLFFPHCTKEKPLQMSMIDSITNKSRFTRFSHEMVESRKFGSVSVPKIRIQSQSRKNLISLAKLISRWLRPSVFDPNPISYVHSFSHRTEKLRFLGEDGIFFFVSKDVIYVGETDDEYLIECVRQCEALYDLGKCKIYGHFL